MVQSFANIRRGQLTALACVTALACNTTAQARDFRMLADAKGSITGTVLQSDGSPAKACVIKIFAPIDWSGGQGKGGKVAGFWKSPVPNFLEIKGAVMATTTSDEKGKFEFKTVKVGNFRFVAGTIKTGMAGGIVAIEEGKATTLDLKLNPPLKT